MNADPHYAAGHRGLTHMANDRWALVTGAGQRLGRRIAEALAEDGYAVAVHYHRSADDAAEVADRIRRQGGVARAVAADFTAPDDVATLLARAAEALGGAATTARSVCLVNNAALFEHDDEEAVWDAHMAVNLRAPARLVEQLVALVRSNAAAGSGPAEGAVVNILDRSVVNPPAEFESYNISKSALWAATRMAARTAAPAVRVNAVAPGPTIAHPRQSARHFEALGKATPLGRTADPQEVADAVRFLLGNRSITGELLLIDGGWHLL